MEHKVVTTNEACPALLVPTGYPVTLPAGTFLKLTQASGRSFTVVFQGNMYWISGQHAALIGQLVDDIQFPQPQATHVVEENIWHALRQVFDPEIPVNLADLGLIYSVVINNAQVDIAMTLTAPGCGMGPVLVQEVKDTVQQVPGVEQVVVELVFDPPWSRDMMTEEAQLELGIF